MDSRPGYSNGDLDMMAFLVVREADAKASVKPVRRRMMSPGWKVILASIAIFLSVSSGIAQ